MKKLLGFVGLIFAAATAQAAVQGKEVNYSANGTTLKGYIAYDDAVKGKRPGILVIHEWWGNNEYSRRRARMFAEQGYTAMALDMYGDGKLAQNPDEARKYSGEIYQNPALAKARFDAAFNRLAKERSVDAKKIAAVGYCFGGGVALNMARAGEPLKAVLSFHGGLATDHPAQAGTIKAHVASFSGDADPVIPTEQVAAFRQEMDKAGVIHKIVIYPGAKHAFSNPEADKLGQEFNMPIAYNAAADKASWSEGLAFLADAFKAK